MSWRSRSITERSLFTAHMMPSLWIRTYEAEAQHLLRSRNAQQTGKRSWIRTRTWTSHWTNMWVRPAATFSWLHTDTRLSGISL